MLPVILAELNGLKIRHNYFITSNFIAIVIARTAGNITAP